MPGKPKYADLFSDDDDDNNKMEEEDFDYDNIVVDPIKTSTVNKFGSGFLIVPDQIPSTNYITDELYLNRQRTKQMAIRSDFVHLKDQQLQINLGSGAQDYVQYKHVDKLGKGAFSTCTKVVDTKTGEFFALKIYKIKEQERSERFNFGGESNIDKIKTECRFWSQFVNDHIPRLYEWYENEYDKSVIARSELGDIGGAGVWDPVTKTFTLDIGVYDLFQEKIIAEDKVLRNIICMSQHINMNKDNSKENRQVIAIKDAKNALAPYIEKKIQTQKYSDLMMMEGGDDLFNDFDDDLFAGLDDQDYEGYGMEDLDDLRMINRNSSILVRNMTTTQNDLMLKTASLNKNIFFHQELKSMPMAEQRQFVVGRIFFDICIGLYYMHLWKVAHQDIKFDNFVISSKNNGKAMIIDFNSVKQFSDEHEKFYEMRGTEEFSAPECRVTGQYYPEKYDMFSLGCTLYTLYYGKLCCDSTFDFIKGRIYFLEDTPIPILTLMKGLLQVDPYQRWTWDKVWPCLQFEMLHKKIEVQVDKPIATNQN